MRCTCSARRQLSFCVGEFLSSAEGRAIFIVSAAAGFVFLFASRANAQAIPLNAYDVAPPWNALQVFETSPLPDFRDPDRGDPVPPEDTPVRTRQQPGYEPVGIRF